MSASKPLLYLIDASQLVYRGQHLPQQYPHISAMLGFIEFVKRIQQRSKACPLLFAFDQTRSQCVRRALDPSYKAGRRKLSDDKMQQFPWVREWVQAQGWPQCSSPAYEADDLLASFAREYRQRGYALRIVSSDKDLMQLVGVDDQWWDLHRDVRLDYRAVCRRTKVKPEQLADLLALTGDRADNIPGVRGVGPGIAARLLHRFETVAHLLECLPEVAQMKFRGSELACQSLQQQVERVALNKKLTLLHDELPIAQQLSIERQPVDESRLQQLSEPLHYAFSALR